MRRIFILYTQSALGAGVASALIREPGFDISGSTYINRAILFREVDRFKPQIVIFDENLHNSEPRLVYDLFERGRSTSLVVIIEAEQNRVRLYERRAVPIEKPRDLISVLKEPDASPWAPEEIVREFHNG